MKKILKVDNPNDYAQFVDAPVLHPPVQAHHGSYSQWVPPKQLIWVVLLIKKEFFLVFSSLIRTFVAKIDTFIIK